MGVHLLPAQTHVEDHKIGLSSARNWARCFGRIDAQAYRDVQFIARMHSAGIKAADDGDVAIPSYLPHHSIPPIRSWPAPRIAWECVSECVAPLLQQPMQVPLLIGCDCSVE